MLENDIAIAIDRGVCLPPALPGGTRLLI